MVTIKSPKISERANFDHFVKKFLARRSELRTSQNGQTGEKGDPWRRSKRNAIVSISVELTTSQLQRILDIYPHIVYQRKIVSV
jgi:hypothetical protein